MDKKTALMIAGLCGGHAVLSIIGTYLIEVENTTLQTRLRLGEGKWWIEDWVGEHIVEGDKVV